MRETKAPKKNRETVQGKQAVAGLPRKIASLSLVLESLGSTEEAVTLAMLALFKHLVRVGAQPSAKFSMLLISFPKLDKCRRPCNHCNIFITPDTSLRPLCSQYPSLIPGSHWSAFRYCHLTFSRMSHI